MTMLVRLSGGENGPIHPPFMIFQNKNRSYPVQNVLDDVPGVCYRTQPKDWMKNQVFEQWLDEPGSIRIDTYHRERINFLDNCGGQKITPEIEASISKIKTVLKFLSPNATEKCQPCNSFIIQKIKRRWSELWDLKKAELLNSDNWLKGSKSGKIPNPGKHYFLKLAAHAMRDVNHVRDENGIGYYRKAMLRCGLSLDLDGVWRIEQLFPHLQELVKKHKNHFDCDPVLDLS